MARESAESTTESVPAGGPCGASTEVVRVNSGHLGTSEAKRLWSAG